MQYTCGSCKMSVKGLTCGNCNEELVPGTITNEQGQAIQVSKCPNNCGMIKSPMCCGKDMKPSV